MSYKSMLLDSRGAPVAQGVSEDGPEKNVWQLRIAHGDIKRVLGHEYISLVGTSEQFPAMEGRIVRCRDNLVSVESVRMLGVDEVAEIVIPVTAEPLVLRVKILRERPSPEPIPLYAAEFVDMLREEENMVCEAVFSLQFRHTAEM